MILEFSVENTYSIKDRQTISFEAADTTDDEHIIKAGNKRLLKFAALYGANASGKSNMLKAFDFYIRFIFDSFTMLKPQEEIPFMPFLFSENQDQLSGFFELVFYFENIWYKYQITLNKEIVLQERLSTTDDIEETVIYNLDTIATKHEYPKDGEEIVRFVRPNATFLSTAAQFNHGQIGKIYQYFKKTLITIFDTANKALLTDTLDYMEESENRRESVFTFLQKADIGNIGGIAIQKAEIPKEIIGQLSPDQIIYKTDGKTEKFYGNLLCFVHSYNNQEYYLPFGSESQGTQQIFMLSLPILKALENNSFIIINEIESSLHDDLLKFFIRTFLENTTQSQLLFATHNQNLLDSELLRDDEVWFVQKDENGTSEFFSLAEFKDIPENVSRRELYKAGAFGALPRISSFFKE